MAWAPDRSVSVREAATWRETGLVRLGEPVIRAGVNPGATVLAVATEAGEIVRWDLRASWPAGPRLTGLKSAGGAFGADALTFSPDGTMLAIVNYFNETRVWQLADGKVLARISQARAAAFSPDSSVLAVGEEGGDLVLYPTGRPSRGRGSWRPAWTASDRLRVGDDPVNSVAFNQDGASVCTAGRSGAIQVWRFAG